MNELNRKTKRNEDLLKEEESKNIRKKKKHIQRNQELHR